MSKTDEALFGDMLKYARKAIELAGGATREAFDHDEKLQFALAYAIMIIGEAGSRLTEDGRAALPQLPWSDIIGMRHRLVHGYGSISRNIIWDVLSNDLEPLISALEKLDRSR